ncbi:hypothetical protein A3Q56_06024 [Intoshia linei]|uniref:Queuosine 5'-phosphate N-glycosylase/hydrolase n=1 Tax=Intoshia linei TaxID=1819745 RepID=A0A177AXL3_9BILA|nr:hypothetical protein A3Q56_06024 [Intoshia linei]
MKYIPLIKERLIVLHSVGNYLIKENLTVADIVKNSKNDVKILIQNILKIDSFDDFNKFSIVTEGKSINFTIYFLKRAQIFIADLYCTFKNEGFGKFVNIDKLTVMADYRIPQKLNTLKILHYSHELSNKLKDGDILQRGSNYEVEIRANTVIACQYTLENALIPHCAPLNHKFVPEYSKTKDYETHHIAKWNLGFYHKNCTAVKRGFD